MTKIKKRKEYMNEAERVALRLMVSYYEEHGSLPNDSVLKSAMTKGRDVARRQIMVETTRRVGGQWDSQTMQNPMFGPTLCGVIKEIKEDVNDFWVRQQQ